MATSAVSLKWTRRAAREASCVGPQSESGKDFKLRGRLSADLPLSEGGISEPALSALGTLSLGGEGRVGTHCPLSTPRAAWLRQGNRPRQRAVAGPRSSCARRSVGAGLEEWLANPAWVTAWTQHSAVQEESAGQLARSVDSGELRLSRCSLRTGREMTMDPYDAPESTPRQHPSCSLKDYFLGATPLQRRLESVRKQATSFVPTPPRRKIPQCSQLLEDVDPQKVAFLLHKQWTLYSLTPLYKFSYTNLKEYSRLLSAFITAEKQKGLAVEVGEDFNIKVIFSTLLGMKGTQRDPEAVLVQILSKSQLPSEDREGKVLWTGWFCCVFGDSLLETVSEDFTCLPLFLANGTESNTAIIGTWFQKTFDCYFSPLAINAFNLSWMAAMWTACKMDRYVATTEFLWSVPCSPQSLDISYAIHPEDAKALWDGVHKTPGEVTQEEVDLFMDCLYSHFYRHFRIHLSATRLVRVSTSVASAHTDGKIKIICHKYLIGVLAYLTELAIFQIE